MNTTTKIEQEVFEMKLQNISIYTEDNLKSLLDECMGQEDLMQELVRLFKKNMLEFIGHTKIALQNEDIQSIGFASHKIKSGLRMLKIDGLLLIAEEMNAVCKGDGDLKHLNFLYAQFLDEYPIVEQIIDSGMKKL